MFFLSLTRVFLFVAALTVMVYVVGRIAGWWTKSGPKNSDEKNGKQGE